MLKAAGAAALSPAASSTAAIPGPRSEGKDTPKICLGSGDGGGLGPDAGGSLEEREAAAARRIKQIGVDYVLSGGARIPWEEDQLRARMERLKAQGITLGNLMIGGFSSAIYNRPGRDEDIEKVIQSVKAGGKPACR